MAYDDETESFRAECRNHAKSPHLAPLFPAVPVTCVDRRLVALSRTSRAPAVMKVCRDQSPNEPPETIVTLVKRTRDKQRDLPVLSSRPVVVFNFLK